jgi:hypothetical protein
MPLLLPGSVTTAGVKTADATTADVTTVVPGLRS